MAKGAAVPCLLEPGAVEPWRAEAWTSGGSGIGLAGLSTSRVPVSLRSLDRLLGLTVLSRPSGSAWFDFDPPDRLDAVE